ncbi:MAG: flagellar protein FlaB, partial [Desulfobulbaceae bacterium]|nr:flagellar protein FlaB [Desulfobulbaceae bacterium]
GTTLEEDVTIEGNQMLSEGMALAAGSELAAGTLIAKGSQVPEATADQAEGLRTVTGSVSDINVLSQQGATDALSIVDEALNQINTMRSEIGSTQNQLSSTIANLSVNEVNTAAAQSQIRDIDFAEEVMNLNKLQVLTQARLFALSQGSKVNQSRIMNLLQG